MPETILIIGVFVWIGWMEYRLRISMRRLRDVAWAYGQLVNSLPSTQQKTLRSMQAQAPDPRHAAPSPIAMAHRRTREHDEAS